MSDSRCLVLCPDLKFREFVMFTSTPLRSLTLMVDNHFAKLSLQQPTPLLSPRVPNVSTNRHVEICKAQFP
ncbi:hypothetical protein L596_029617 [Steinernema carpocapsae]|uniref:Uncharacterized protein n=1 Tax=Steinernema carpocapsae TaxID=34508 RepID=A0A4U5LV61_STECR|nr:hypothetical protein L596_029617 [Steinernema carpocapsae]